MTAAGSASAGPPVPGPRTVVVTLSSPGRAANVLRQHRVLAALDPGVGHLVVRLGAPDWTPWPDPWTLDVPVEGGLPLARARNLGVDAAVAAGADLVVLLDADCLPTSGLLPGYRAALDARPDAVACGPVTYLPAGAPVDDPAVLADPAAWERLVDPHPARPDPPDGTTVAATADEYRLFWSLSFALRAPTWRRLRAQDAAFHEEYVGYGVEDTDAGQSLRAVGVPLLWTGGAHALHQHHPVSDPPVEHVDSILRNARVFARRWGWWPAEGWMADFARLGLIRPDPDGGGWVRTPTR